MVAVFIFVVFLGVLDIGGPKSRKDSTSYRIQHLFAIFHWESNFFLLRVPHPSLPLRTPSNNNNLWEKVTNLPLECIGFIDVTYSNWTAISTNSRMVITETTISLPVKCGRPVNQRFINLYGVIVFNKRKEPFGNTSRWFSIYSPHAMTIQFGQIVLSSSKDLIFSWSSSISLQSAISTATALVIILGTKRSV